MTTLQEAARLEDPDFYNIGDPYPTYERLRHEAPVFWYERDGVGFWALSRWDDIREVSAKPELFSTERGLLSGDPRALREHGQLLSEGQSPPGAENILASDPPTHTNLRKLVSRVFTPRMIAKLESRVRELVQESFEPIVPGEPFDFVEALAVPLPMYVIGDMLGVPREHRARFKRWADNGVSAGTVVFGDDGVEASMAERSAVANEMHEYFTEQLQERERSPRDDLMSGLVTAEIGGERLSEPNQVMMCATILAAGNETTRNLISGAALALAAHPDQAQALAADPSLIAVAVDEFLRWVTPVMTFGRTAKQDTVVHGQAINEGDYLLMLYSSANRDEDVWDHPEVFDVTRENDPMHLAFGWGEHLCLGQNLARLEVRAFFEEFLTRYRSFEVAGDPERIPSTLINGVQRLPFVVNG